MKKILIFILSIFILCGCSQEKEIEKEITEKVVYINNDVYKKYSDAHVLKLNGSEVLLDDKKVNEYDYTWHISPEQEDEYYTGNKPEENKEVYLAHDIIYYPEINEESFVKQNYDGEMEWVKTLIQTICQKVLTTIIFLVVCNNPKTNLNNSRKYAVFNIE